MGRKALNRFSAWFGLCLLAGGILYLIFGLWPGWRPEIEGLLSGLDYRSGWPRSILSFAAALLSLRFAPCAWQELLKTVTGARLKAREIRRNWFITQMASYIPGRVMIFLGRMAFLRSRDVGMGPSIAMMALENIFLMVSACLVALVSLPFVGRTGVPGEVKLCLAIASMALLAVLAAPGLRNSIAGAMAKKFGRPRADIRFPRIPGRSLRLIVGAGMLSWMFRGVSLFLWFDFAGVGQANRLEMLAACIIVAPVSWLVSLIWVIVPGGIGIRESVQGLMLAPFAGNLPVAVTISLSHRLVLILAEGLFALEAAVSEIISHRISQFVNAAKLVRAMAGALGARMGLWRAPMPVNITFSVTRRCQSRCSTCLIWKADELPELDIETIERIFKSTGWTYFFNISGGEPFLRKDLPGIVRLACRHLHPAVIHIPTNALMPERIEEMTKEILEAISSESPGTVLTVKPSFDGVGARHDEIRGVPGNFEKLLDTLGRLRRLRESHPSLHIGVGTVISRFNAPELPGVIEYAASLGVDTYINEIAEEREEFFNLGTGITPDPAAYRSIMNIFRKATLEKMKDMSLLGRITSGLRLVYYDLVVRILEEKRQVVPCYAGLLNVHINADGGVWPCAIRAYASEMGRIGVDGGFREIWRSSRARTIRRSIRRGECWCPLANQAYSNILMHPPSLLAALFGKGRRGRDDSTESKTSGGGSCNCSG